MKRIRTEQNMSQEQLANKIGVSSVTVNRWENGKAKPMVMAQNIIYELCKQNHIDIVNFITSPYCKQEKEHILYHAFHKGISGKIQPISRSKCDFEKGFYTGTDSIQPLTLVCNEDNPKFYELETVCGNYTESM